MPVRYRRTCLNAWGNRRERSLNFDNNAANVGFWSPLGSLPLLLNAPVNGGPGEWVATRNVAVWPNATDSAAPAAQLTGDGRVSITLQAGAQSASGVTTSVTYNENKRHIVTLSSVFFQEYGNTQNPAAGVGCEYDSLGTNAVGIDLIWNIGTSNANGTLSYREGGTAKASITVPTSLNITGSPMTLKLDVGAWNGTNRVINAYIGSNLLITFTTTTAPNVAPNKFCRFISQSGNLNSVLPPTFTGTLNFYGSVT